MPSVLIVDDDVVARSTLALLLAHRGLSPRAVGSGGEALVAMRAQPSDVVLLDVRLPDSEGLDLIAPLKGIKPDVGVIVMTGYAALDGAVRALDAGAAAYVAKPAAASEVLARIEGILDRQRLVAAKEAAELALRRHVALEALVARLSTRFVNLSHREIDKAVADALGQVGHALGADAGCLVWLGEDDCAGASVICSEEGGVALGERLRRAARAPEPWWKDLLHTGTALVVEADDDSSPLADLAVGLDTKRLILVPIRIRRAPAALLAVALGDGAGAWHSEDASFLETIGQALAAALDRKQVDAARGESAMRLQALIENIADVIVVLRSDGTIGYVSPSVGTAFGYLPSDPLNPSVMYYVHPDDRAAVQAAYLSCVANPGSIQHFGARVLHADGHWCDVEGTGLNCLYDPSIGGIVLNCRDVTARRAAERELRHHVDLGNLLARVSSLFIGSSLLSIDDAIGEALCAIGSFFQIQRSLFFRIDRGLDRISATHEWCAGQAPRHLEGLRHVRCNDLHWFVRHMASGEVLEVPDVEGMPPEASPEQEMLRAQGVRSSIAVPVSYQSVLVGALMFDSDSPRVWAPSDVTLLRTVGEILVNAMERQRTEEQLLQSSKMASLGMMAGGIAHELRNPLGVVSAAAQLMRGKPRNRRLQEECVTRIMAASRRASEIIDGLLTFARPADGQMRSMDVRDAIADALGLVGHRLEECHVRVAQQHAGDLPRVTGNAAMLAQVFSNLVLNACNAMPEGGSLVISTRSMPEGLVEVRFADTGVGIPPENVDSIFDPFFTTMPVGQGTGLGLTVSYSIVQRHAGTIGVESEVGRGTEVMVRLPVEAEQPGGDDGTHPGGG